MQVSPTNFKAPDSQFCLVYLENTQPFADFNGSTHMARLITSFEENNRLWHKVQIVTSLDGDTIYQPKTITVLDSTIVSKRPVQDIQPHRLYQISTPLDGINFNQPKATGFVIKSQTKQPLASTSRSGFGAGIYGIFVKHPSQVDLLLTDRHQRIYPIDYAHPYIIQDKEHGDSLTIASLHTNTYVDRLIEAIRTTTSKEIANPSTLIRLNPIDNLVNLWNIVLLRTHDPVIDTVWLETILTAYIQLYLQENSLFDTSNGTPIQELPINHILSQLGYDGLLAKDGYNNRWNRGCVRYSRTAVLQGSVTSY